MFDALSKSILAAVQLSVILDKNEPSNAVEMYTFAFRYKSSNTGPQLGQVTFTGAHGCPVTISSAQSGLQKIVGYLTQVAEVLPDLPRKLWEDFTMSID